MTDKHDDAASAMANRIVYISMGASFSPCRRYRYRLWRQWDASLPSVVWLMLNPSTADELVLDPTLRRCQGYARQWGAGGFEVLNLFALRSTDPKGLYGIEDPVGPDNDQTIADTFRLASLAGPLPGYDRPFVAVGWGRERMASPRARQLVPILPAGMELRSLRVNQDGSPQHPLYLPAAAKPEIWKPREDKP